MNFISFFFIYNIEKDRILKQSFQIEAWTSLQSNNLMKIVTLRQVTQDS